VRLPRPAHAALQAGAGIAFVTEESLVGAAVEPLADWVARQPPWSDFPFIVLVARRVGRRPSDATGTLAKLGNVVLLERPLNTDTLVSAARSALRGRDRQYQTRRHLIEQEEARIAERIANAEASRANEALEVAVEAGELGTFHCPWPLRVIEWNAKCKEHFWLPADAEVDFDRFYSLIHDDDRENVRAAIDAAVDGRGLYDVEYRTVSSDGRQRWIRAKGRVYRETSGEPTRFDGVTLDISRQKQLEVEREALLAPSAGPRRGRAGEPHEGRVPGDAVARAAHAAQRHPRLDPSARPADAAAIDVAKAAATIERNARAQARLIEELLDVSRITSGNLHLDIQPVSIAAVFETVVSSLKPAADARSIRLRQDPDDAGEVLADASRLQQVVWNLVSNAIKFTPAGGQVLLSARRSETEVVLTVSDDGVGISADFLPHVFERFRQAESNESRTHGGLGLGLAIVRQLVELHGGKVEACSAGVGAARPSRCACRCRPSRCRSPLRRRPSLRPRRCRRRSRSKPTCRAPASSSSTTRRRPRDAVPHARELGRRGARRRVGRRGARGAERRDARPDDQRHRHAARRRLRADAPHPRDAAARAARPQGDRAHRVRARRRRGQGAPGRLRRPPAEAGRSVAPVFDDRVGARRRVLTRRREAPVRGRRDAAPYQRSERISGSQRPSRRW
jgi:PAS domain S-box-containing protein